MVGKTLSHYKVIEIGPGGMGEVCRAEDTNLSREVAKSYPRIHPGSPARIGNIPHKAQLPKNLKYCRDIPPGV